MLDMVISSDAHGVLPEAVKSEYVEREGQFELQVDGAFSRIDRDKLHGALEKERGDHRLVKATLASFGEITPEKFETVWNTVAELNTQLETRPDADSFNDAVGKVAESRVQAATRPLERQITALTGERDTAIGERDTLTGKINQGTISDTVVKAFQAKAIGGITDARADVQLWAERVFHLNEAGDVVAREIDGITPGLSPKEVFTDMVAAEERRHWFGKTTGAGARKGGNVDLTNNVFKLDEKTGKVANMTACHIAIKRDPVTAKRMIEAAGAGHFFPRLVAPDA